MQSTFVRMGRLYVLSYSISRDNEWQRGTLSNAWIWLRRKHTLRRPWIQDKLLVKQSLYWLCRWWTCVSCMYLNQYSVSLFVVVSQHHRKIDRNKYSNTQYYKRKFCLSVCLSVCLSIIASTFPLYDVLDHTNHTFSESSGSIDI